MRALTLTKFSNNLNYDLLYGRTENQFKPINSIIINEGFMKKAIFTLLTMLFFTASFLAQERSNTAYPLFQNGYSFDSKAGAVARLSEHWFGLDL